MMELQTYLVIGAALVCGMVTGLQQAWDGHGTGDQIDTWYDDLYAERKIFLWGFCVLAAIIAHMNNPFWIIPLTPVLFATIESSPNGLFRMKWENGSSNPLVIIRYATYPALWFAAAYFCPLNPSYPIIWPILCFIPGIYYFVTRRINDKRDINNKLPNLVTTRIAEFNRGFCPVVGLAF